MTLWDIQMDRWAGSNLARVEAEVILVGDREPVTFVLHDGNGSLMLAHLLGREADTSRYAVVPTTDAIVAELASGARSLRSALDQPTVWVADVGPDGTTRSVWVCTLADLPPHVLPAADPRLR
jgi:hypothetical protein